MIDINKPHQNLECEVCDDYDHCLPRWEDDGGEMVPQPSLAQAFGEDYEDNHGDHDRPPDGSPHQPI